MPVPAPIVWTDGEDPTNIPSADDLNTDWRDSFNFLLGYTRPIIILESTTGQALASGVAQDINFQLEILKRGGMIHATNGSTVTVPYTGEYVGYMYVTATGFSTVTNRLQCWITKSGTSLAKVDQRLENNGGHELHGSVTLNLAANDVISLTIKSTAATATSGTSAGARPKLALFYVGDYV